MRAEQSSRWGRVPARSWFRISVGVVSLLLVLFGSGLVATGEDGFEIIVPVSTVVRAPEGSVTVVSTTAVPSELVGQTCSVTARSENQSSVHPDNDLVVESQTQIVLEDVEAEPGGIVTSMDTTVLGDEIVISLVMGPDGVFSAGIDVLFDCPPGSTTTSSVTSTSSIPETTTTYPGDSTTTTDSGTTTSTSGGSTTTTVDDSTTTTVDDSTTTTEDNSTTTTEDDSTTTTSGGSTTTTEDDSTTTTSRGSTTTTTDSGTTTTTTDSGSTTTTMGGSTTSTSTPGVVTTTTDEVLAYTGDVAGELALFAVAVTAAGILLLVGERNLAPSTAGITTPWVRRCRQCDRSAEFMTPHGRLCRLHTRLALDEDDELWMPQKLSQDPPWGSISKRL